ncbi:hypothetical protein Tco_1313920 [Tanacetum coccineum]
MLLLFKVITPPSTGIFSIPWAVNGIACSFLTHGLPIIPLYRDGDLTTTKFIKAEVESSSSPILTNSCICPIGHIISPLNPIKQGWASYAKIVLISGRSRMKQCSYNISEAEPPSTYMRCMQWPHISASMIIGPSVPSSSPRGGKRIFRFTLSLHLGIPSTLMFEFFYYGRQLSALSFFDLFLQAASSLKLVEDADRLKQFAATGL